MANISDVNLVAAGAPVVALLASVLFYRSLSRKDRGPEADYWEEVRRTLLPPLDLVLKRAFGGYAAYELSPDEYVGRIKRPPEEVETLLWTAGFERNPLAAYKTLPDGQGEIGSWAYRESVLADTQVHVMLFAGEDGGTLVFAHEEDNALNPTTALAHYRGANYSPMRGEEAVRRLLPPAVWDRHGPVSISRAE